MIGVSNSRRNLYEETQLLSCLCLGIFWLQHVQQTKVSLIQGRPFGKWVDTAHAAANLTKTFVSSLTHNAITTMHFIMTNYLLHNPSYRDASLY